ncbi:hypothetical protein P4S95_12315 [Aneurinibacillus aneurinilyticus]|nr:hypothetical protein [Aneurinibacillus aneurinilyticus]
MPTTLFPSHYSASHHSIKNSSSIFSLSSGKLCSVIQLLILATPPST